MQLSAIQAKIPPLCRQHDVKWLGVFGSVARNEATEASDIDLLVDFSKRKSLLALIRLERELSELLGRKVDLLTRDAVSPYLKDRILKEVKVLYDYEA